MNNRRHDSGYWIRLVGVLGAEGIILGLLLTVGSVLGSVEWSDPAQWLARSDPTSVLTALIRLVLVALTAWMLLTSALYGFIGRGDAVVDGRRGWAAWTFPFLRRLIDGAAAVSVMVSAVTSSASAPATAATARGPVAEQTLSDAGRRAVVSGPDSVPTSSGLPAGALSRQRQAGRHLPHPGLAGHNAPGPGAHIQAERLPIDPGLPEGTPFYVVRPGDCLSVIAERHLGDWRRDAEIDQLNRGRPQPDGRALIDDHWIYPGWVLVMPPDAVDVQRAATRGSAPASAALGGATARATPPFTTSPALGGTRTAATDAGASLSEGEGDGPDEAIPHRPSSVAGGAMDEARRAAEAAGVGLLLAGAVVAGLRRRRREAMHDRLSGWRIRRNRAAVESAETLTRAKAGGGAGALMHRVDLALQVLGRELLEWDDRAAPCVALVRAASDGIEVMVDPPTEGAPRHFEAVEDGRLWVLDPSLETAELESLAETCGPFLPALISAGETSEGTVLVNLEHAAVLRVTGDPERVSGVLAQAALELRCQPWSGEAIASLIVDDAGSEGPGRLSDAVIETVLRSARRCQEAMGETATAAVQRAASFQWLPTVAVCGPGTDPGLLGQLCSAARPDRTALAVVVAGQEGTGWTLQVSGDGAAVLSGELNGSGFTLPLRRDADPSLLGLLEEALDRPLGEPPPPESEGSDAPQGGLAEMAGTVELPELDAWIAEVEGEWEDEGMAGEEGPERGARVAAFRSGEVRDIEVTVDLPVDAGPVAPGSPTDLATPAPVELTILGPVGLEGSADLQAVPASRRASALAVVCFLATRRRPVPAGEIAAALWPVDSGKDNFGEPRRKTVMNVISRARVLLGEPLSGPSRLLLTERGYLLSPEVGCDWSRFERLIDAPFATPAEEARALRSALELVTGPPLAGSLSGPFFEWVSAQHLDLAIQARVVDTAERLGQLALQLEDPPGAEWAIHKGLELDPAREELYRVWMHVAGQSGRPDQVDEIYRRLCRALQRHLDAGMAPSDESDSVRGSYSSRSIRV